MHRHILFAAFALIASGSAAIGDEVQGRILGYGIIKRPDSYRTIETPGTASGHANLVDKPVVTVTTQKIPAKLGVRFGCFYEISNLPIADGEKVKLVRVTRCPALNKPDGSIFTGAELPLSYTVVRGRVEQYTGFGFDHDYELVPGTWTFEIRFGDKILCRQDFIISIGE